MDDDDDEREDKDLMRKTEEEREKKKKKSYINTNSIIPTIFSSVFLVDNRQYMLLRLSSYPALIRVKGKEKGPHIGLKAASITLFLFLNAIPRE